MSNACERDIQEFPDLNDGGISRRYDALLKINAHCERFNCAIQKESVDYHEGPLFSDLKGFNDKRFDR